MYQNRTLEAFVQKANTQFPVLLLTGPRQVGKTTLLAHVQTDDNRTYVTLDDPMARSLAKEDPALFLQRFAPPVFIDEIQYAPELLPYIKIRVDRSRADGSHASALFWLTGSQQFHLMKNVSESLAGRVGIIQLLGFSQRELNGASLQIEPFLPEPEFIFDRLKNTSPPSLSDIYRRIWRGAFPIPALHETTDHDLFYSSYVQTYLQRDVRDLTHVGDEMAFLRFLRAAAARTGTLTNVSALAKDADVSPSTAKQWLSILETSGIVYLLAPYHSNLSKRLVKAPKLYFTDTGLCAYLTGWSSPETLEAGAMSGPMLETWVVNEVLKSYLHAGRPAPLYFYRDKDTKEIDLLIEKDGVIYPLEIKKTASPSRNIARQFQLISRFGKAVGPGGVICFAETALPLSETVYAIPVTAL